MIHRRKTKETKINQRANKVVCDKISTKTPLRKFCVGICPFLCVANMPNDVTLYKTNFSFAFLCQFQKLFDSGWESASISLNTGTPFVWLGSGSMYAVTVSLSSYEHQSCDVWKTLFPLSHLSFWLLQSVHILNSFSVIRPNCVVVLVNQKPYQQLIVFPISRETSTINFRGLSYAWYWGIQSIIPVCGKMM